MNVDQTFQTHMECNSKELLINQSENKNQRKSVAVTIEKDSLAPDEGQRNPLKISLDQASNDNIDNEYGINYVQTTTLARLQLHQMDKNDISRVGGTSKDTEYSSLGDISSRKWQSSPPLIVQAFGEGEPFIVNMRVAIKNISRVSTVDGTAFVRMGIVYYWNDHRLIDWPEDEEIPSNLWCPKLICVNREDNFQTAPDGLHLVDASTGRLKRGYNIDGYITNPLEDMEFFPFDVDALDIQLYTESNWETPNASIQGMDPKCRIYQLRPVENDGGEGKFWWFGWDGSIEEWNMHGYSYFIEEHPPTASGALGTSVHLKFHLSRLPGFYISKVVVPLIVLWQMQFWTFAFPVEELIPKLSHISTLLLTTSAVVYVISAFLPKLAFLTLIDRTVRSLFLTITLNGWFEIIGHSIRAEGHLNTLYFFRSGWLSTNLIIFFYFQYVDYVLPYVRLKKIRKELDKGEFTITNTDKRFHYTIHKQTDKRTTMSLGSNLRQSMRRFSRRKSQNEEGEKEV